MKFKTLNTLAGIVLFVGVIGMLLLFKPLVLSDVTRTFGSFSHHREGFNLLGFVLWCFSGLGWFTIYAILKALASILERLKIGDTPKDNLLEDGLPKGNLSEDDNINNSLN